MSKIKMRSSFANKIIIALIIVIIGVILILVSYNIVYKGMNSLAYDLGEKSNIKGYEDVILTNYEEYKNLVLKYNVSRDLSPSNFETNYYIASFQEYDSCSEKKYKEVSNIEYGDNIKITFKIYNKCGWCKRHLVLHLIKVDKVDNKSIIYDYVYDKQLECGTIK